MKVSKMLHVTSVVVGIIGVVAFIGIVLSKGSDYVYGIPSAHALLCVIILFLIAIWCAVGTMHHMMLEKKGEII